MVEGHTVADTRMADLRYLEGARRTALKHGLVSPATLCLSRLATLRQSRLTRTVCSQQPLWNWFAGAGSIGVPCTPQSLC